MIFRIRSINIRRFIKKVFPTVLLIGITGCSLFNSPEVELIGDFAPLEVGNVWEYEFIKKASSYIFYHNIQSIMTVTLLSIEYLNDLTNYTFSVKDSGALTGYPGLGIDTGEIFETCTVTISENKGEFDSFTFCNDSSENLFIAHMLPVNKTVRNGSEIEYRESSGNSYNGNTEISRIYRAGTGLIYHSESMSFFGGSSTMYRESMQLSLISFNGEPVVQIEL